MSRPKKGRTRNAPRSLDAIIAEMHPTQLAGLAVGGEPVSGSATPLNSDKEAPTTASLIAHMGTPGAMGSVVEADHTEVWTFGDDRTMGGIDRTITAEHMGKIKAGYECLRCWEPQIGSFPLKCDVCGYPMRDRQIHDIALEVQGTKHLGPSKPIGDYIDILDEEAEKKRFVKKIATGGSVRRRTR